MLSLLNSITKSEGSLEPVVVTGPSCGLPHSENHSDSSGENGAVEQNAKANPVPIDRNSTDKKRARTGVSY